MQMTRDTMHVNMELGDGGVWSLANPYGLASWLKDVYHLQYQTEFGVKTTSIATELYHHADFFFAPTTIERSHARVADIGVAGAELRRERFLWDYILTCPGNGDPNYFNQRKLNEWNLQFNRPY